MMGWIKRLLKIKIEYMLFLILLLLLGIDLEGKDTQGKIVWEVVLVGLALACLVFQTIRDKNQPDMGLTREQELTLDPMTCLFNHRKVSDLLQERMEQAAQVGQEVAVLYFDLDDFKPINQNYGYQVGDDVLMHVANILHAHKRPFDFVGRYAGDEFLMVLPQTTIQEAEQIAETFQVLLGTESFRLHEYEEALPISVSIGVAHYPEHAQSATTLIDFAIKSKEEAKRAGKAKIKRVPSYMHIEKYVEDSSSSLELFIKSLKDKDTYTVAHSEDVARYALMLAEALSLPEMMKRELRTAGIFHDIGKILIPDSILKKPGRLTDEEYEMMKKHVILSHEILINHYTSETMKQAVICHHERFDGKGYPLGLRGMEIPLVGRIMAIADAFSAMTLDRSYRKSKTFAEGIAEIRRCSGEQFDPELTELFCSEMERLQKEQDTKEVLL